MDDNFKIIRVTPIDFYELIIEFENSHYKCFSPEKTNLYKDFSFLAYPNKLKSYKYSSDKITWFNDVSFDSLFLYKNSFDVAKKDLSSKDLRIGFKNQAPTKEHPTHHEYHFSILPFHPEKQFVFSESIGGGHSEMGGSNYYSIDELLKLSDLENHLKLANCSWVIDLIQIHKNDPKLLIDNLVFEVCKRSNPL